jgi:CSLREA domain-containing protein
LAAVLSRGNVEVRRGRTAAGVVAALVCALIAFAALPGFASAFGIEVNSKADEEQETPGTVCLTAAGKCTLRAAIEAANFDPGLSFIEFPDTIFNGEVGEDEIEPTATLPEIKAPVTISGHPCDYPLLGYDAPCVGVKAPAGSPALIVESAGVTVEDVAFGGGESGIEVLDESNGFSANSDWFGLKLDATPDPIGTAGIVLGPGSDEAVIGTDEFEEATRNVFGNSEVGVFVDGASETTIEGNYIGVGPDGAISSALTTGVEIVDAKGPPGSKAEENDVGGILTPAQAASTNCDGPCNVIVTDGDPAVDLTGEAGEPVEPASGPTTIRGNYLGLTADGLTPVGEASVGVFAGPDQSECGGGPADVTVGGSAPTETNYIDGGSVGLFAEGAQNFRALGNSIGFAADRSEGESPIGAGIEVCAEGVTKEAQISNNAMLLTPDAFGIVSDWGRAQITGNTIEGSRVGVISGAESEGHGDLIQGNTISNPDVTGIEIESDSNVVSGNTITSAELAGIEIVTEAEHNRIGGDAPGEANTIVGTGHDGTEEEAAITIFGTTTSRNEVAANFGSANFGPFIQLIGHGGTEVPNGGIEPPAFVTALQSTATGTAQPNATVRIFSKASAEAGELASLLAVAKVDSTGNWTAAYATVPVGTLVAATATSDAGTPAGGTSEVSAPVTAAADPVVPDGGGGGGGFSESGPLNPVPTRRPEPPKAPKVKIAKGPAKRSRSTVAKFRFTAIPAAGARFECKLDAKKFARCASPRTYRNLKPGRHTFQLRATVPGAPASKPAKYQFTLKP